MIVLGLTGSIAMGKSTAAKMFRHRGVKVWDADRVVHDLLGAGGGAVAAIADLYPDVIDEGAVDRAALGRRVFGDAAALRRLEAILHPLVYADQRRFLAKWARVRIPLVVLDVPLLFESGGERVCDAVAVVSAPAFLQRQRLRLRPAMSDARIDAILARQMPDAEKRRRADFVIPTGLGRACSMRAIMAIIARLRAGALTPNVLTPNVLTQRPPGGHVPKGRSGCAMRAPRVIRGTRHARGCSRYRNDGHRSGEGAPHRRDRLC